MKSQSILALQGYVTIRVVGREPERLINLAAAKKFTLWNIQNMDSHELQLNILLKDFFRIRPLLRQTGCVLRVKKRHGFPFFLRKAEKRKWFGLGMLGFLAGIYLLSSIVWQVTVSGNDTIPDEDILAEARKQGVYSMQWKFRMKDPAVTSKILINNIPGVSWVGMEVKGSRVHFNIVEADSPEKRELMSPRNLVSSSDAVITHIFAERGRPIVKVHDRVQKGQVLIKGIYGDEENQEAVISEGTVRGLVWHEFQIVSPLKQKYKVYTGATMNRNYIITGNRALKIWGYGKVPFSKYETINVMHKLQWRSYGIPVGTMTQKLLEVRFDERKLDVPAAREIGLQQARAEILSKTEVKPKIVAEKILHDKTDNGKVYMKVLIEAEENISVEQPIIGQGE
ncbi:sporulation protein [Paenibacillus swuensis]|uniref:Sporulation protein n=1 Tax=Paenibacillus swuensis TaxID=1178515 RepID=A0A172TJV8_9BACL|nr:sporulation protein YqfD [Paenibacillus swuensis]ANE47318.1 sporulation protein [Paenibacillus swuensis]